MDVFVFLSQAIRKNVINLHSPGFQRAFVQSTVETLPGTCLESFQDYCCRIPHVLKPHMKKKKHQIFITKKVEFSSRLLTVATRRLDNYERGLSAYAAVLLYGMTQGHWYSVLVCHDI